MIQFSLMKYGCYIRTEHTYPGIRDQAILAEKLGFDSIHVDDHLIGFDPERVTPYLEAMVLMSAIATQTVKVKIGPVVLANSFRNPALTAKMISSLDKISRGRALFWIGTGWDEEEHKAYGYPFTSAKQRVDQLEESIHIFKRLFTERATTFEGKFWKLENCRNFPKPAQKPWPQMVIGASRDRLTNIACREADGINIPRQGIEALKERIKLVRSKLQKHHRKTEEFEISTFNDVIFVDNDRELDRFVEERISRSARALNQKLTKEHVLKNYFIGYLDDVEEKIRQVEELGVHKMVVVIREESSIKNPKKLFHDRIM